MSTQSPVAARLAATRRTHHPSTPELAIRRPRSEPGNPCRRRPVMLPAPLSNRRKRRAAQRASVRWRGGRVPGGPLRASRRPAVVFTRPAPIQRFARDAVRRRRSTDLSTNRHEQHEQASATPSSLAVTPANAGTQVFSGNRGPMRRNADRVWSWRCPLLSRLTYWGALQTRKTDQKVARVPNFPNRTSRPFILQEISPQGDDLCTCPAPIFHRHRDRHPDQRPVTNECKGQAELRQKPGQLMSTSRIS